jgi:uncharacterized protein YfaQ (DUF2300 family)
MTTARRGARATVLADGRVLVLGGGTLSAEVFDPASRTWRATGAYFDLPDDVAVTLLDGRVLAAGYGSGAVYSPATNQWTPAGRMPTAALAGGAAALLLDGRVLYAGGSYTSCDTTGGYCYNQDVYNQDVPDAEVYTP